MFNLSEMDFFPYLKKLKEKKKKLNLSKHSRTSAREALQKGIKEKLG
jgi:hypothetical protein